MDESGAGCDDDVGKCFEPWEEARHSAGMIVVVNVELAIAAERKRPSRTLTEAATKRADSNGPQQVVRRRAEDYEGDCMHEGLNCKPVPCSCRSRKLEKANCNKKEIQAKVSDRTALQRTLPSVQ